MIMDEGYFVKRVTSAYVWGIVIGMAIGAFAFATGALGARSTSTSPTECVCTGGRP